ncbi:hypothetical protein Cpir12675_003087 [Ceratocystis pirilliformis]|uniref:Small ribosomal subunit protein uS7 domain-containing protein n=1 Tax=Ceratocystis pirilliformis TaxID=259994 RepID=A0ABR3Z666_9PEZI
MSSTRSIWGVACRSLAIRSRPVTGNKCVSSDAAMIRLAVQRRFASDSTNLPGSQQPVDPRTGKSSADRRLETMNQGSLKKRGEPAPAAAAGDMSREQMQALFDDVMAKSALSAIPNSMGTAAGGEAADSIASPGFVQVPGGLTEEQANVLYHEGRIPLATTANEALNALQSVAAGEAKVDHKTGAVKPDHKFPLPELPLPPNSRLQERYHPVLHQFVRLLMRDGKLSRAQRQLATVLNILRTSPPPILSPRYPLIPGAPPPAHLPLNPVLYLTVAIDSVSPLIKIRHLAGAAGGGQALDIPFPMEVRQRRRTAFQWIIDVVNKKPSRGSGRNDFPTRLAEEIVAVVEGKSSVWEKRQQVHKSGTVARANLNTFHGGKKGHRIVV